MGVDLTHDEEDLAIGPALKTIGYYNGMRIMEKWKEFYELEEEMG